MKFYGGVYFQIIQELFVIPGTNTYHEMQWLDREI